MSKSDVRSIERTTVYEMDDLIKKIKKYTSIAVDIDIIYGEW
jgi:hypothetical protein